jgi:hypothetical protein
VGPGGGVLLLEAGSEQGRARGLLRALANEGPRLLTPLRSTGELKERRLKHAPAALGSD